MLDPERYNEQPWPEHPAEREHLARIATLHILKAEWADMASLCAERGVAIISARQFPIMGALAVEVLCPEAIAPLELITERLEQCETSPNRPRTPAEVAAFNARHNPLGQGLTGLKTRMQTI